MRRLACLAIFALFLMPVALARDIERFDYSGIKRGNQIAVSYMSNARSGVDAVQCVRSASAQITDEAVRLGFEFYMFVIDATVEQTLRRDPKFGLEGQQYIVKSVKEHLTVFVTLKRKFFLNTKICVK